MNRQTQQNILFSLLISALGLTLNTLHTMADHMALSLGRLASEAGLLISFYAFGSLISVVLTSTLADWIGKRRMVVVALGVMCVGLSILFLSHSMLPMALGLFLLGFGFGPAEGMASAVLSDENPQNASMWVNIAHAGFGLGAIIGPMLAVLLFSMSGSHHLPFAFNGVMALSFLVWVRFTAREPALIKPQQPLQSPFSMFELLKNKSLIYLALMMFCYMGFESVASAYAKQLFLREGSSEAFSALMISLFWGSMIAGRLIGTRLSGKELVSLRVHAGIAAVGMVLLVFSPSLALRVVAVVLYGFGCGPTWPMLAVLATGMNRERSGAAIGIIMLSTMAGLTVFPTLIGTLPGNLTFTFLAAASLAVLLIVFSRGVKQPEQV